MKSGWPFVRLGEVCEVTPGYAFKSQDWSHAGIPVVKIKNIAGDGTVDLNDVDCIPPTLFSRKLGRFELRDGDIIIAMTGATAGKAGRVRTSRSILLNQRVARLRPNDVDAAFFWALVGSKDYERIFFRLADGAAQPNMSSSQIEGVLIPCPPITVQRRIGSILRAYDDLIEVNRRRIAVLEEMARRLFEEWFVHFRFPGYQADIPRGRLPSGWIWSTLGELASEVRDAVLPSDVSPDTPYVGLEHLPRRSTTLGEWGNVDEVTSTKLKFRPGDILFGKIRPYFHKVVWAPCDGISSSDAIVIRARSDDLTAIVLSVASSDAFVAHAVQTSNGTKMPRANWPVLVKYPVPLPPLELREKFSDYVLNGVQLAATLQAANRRLVASRDLLLPRLISGELSVTAAERELERAA
ncbi:restriction modification system DNA specificity domain protein [Rhodomicrobium vannielii ATCC 17100]|uniref:Restriction modification system DNA specificity domain protein n=1 Tax=Rhodomicrobium vannielii (strain ATCC 17100 / DSM 162 / LMG 4299 / NCIMB 10020 / ATH 3.1.1) TaxID=648757 RepID=E3I0Q2_RHOVT|nr:restriction endonuclease subunit S [Rhodomicrobium vannielii]ADP71142.1 restriction modification system DNA specificity domain protein [Rhodomicrobium vannielii ATCC 17100]